eukprot:m.24263 g.24263  ORF g.24263 m.24263 type:complete len:238 (+) comp9649_c0_seq1:61-774(+)
MSARSERPTRSAAPKTERRVQTGKEPQSVFAEVGVVSQAKGSAFYEMGNTKVIAACYGPMATTRRQGFKETCILDCDVKFSPFAKEAHQLTQQTSLERELSQSLASCLGPCICLSKYPKSVIQVYATVIQDDGAALAAVINAASMALVDAGIEVFDLLAASSVCLDKEGQLHPHPTLADESSSSGSVTAAVMSSLGETTLLHHTGKLSFDQFRKALDQTVEHCGYMHLLQRQFLTRS